MNIAFIPARGGSKSIPLKNIKFINGKPLIYWTAFSANNAQCIDKVVIATDNSDIKKTVLNFGFEKLTVYDRSIENSQDYSTTESVMMEYIENSDIENSDNMFLIQATSPMLKSEHIDLMYSKYIDNNYDSMFSGTREKQFKWIESENGVKPVNYDYQHRPRRQDYIGLIAENGACYINSIQNIKKYNCRLSGKIGFYELPSYMLYELDEPSDWIIVEELMKQL